MDLMGAEQMPGSIQIFLCQSPKPIRITYSRKNIMRLHPIVAVVGAELKKFRQIPMPCIQIYGGGSLAHPQLIYGYCCIIYKTDPADHTSGRTFKAPDAASGRAYLSEIQSHAAAEFADAGKIVNASVNSLQTVGNRINKAARKLMVRLSCIGKRRGSHSHIHPAEHIIKLSHPVQAVFFLFHGKMEGNSQKHLLRRF